MDKPIGITKESQLKKNKVKKVGTFGKKAYAWNNSGRKVILPVEDIKEYFEDCEFHIELKDYDDEVSVSGIYKGDKLVEEFEEWQEDDNGRCICNECLRELKSYLNLIIMVK